MNDADTDQVDKEPQAAIGPLAEGRDRPADRRKGTVNARRSSRWVQYAVLLAVAAAGSVLVYLVEPANSPFYPRCLFHEITGYYCPGCGALRALHEILHGNLTAAFGLNPLFVVALPFLGYLFVSQMLRDLGFDKRRGGALPAAAAWGALALVIVYWVLRNVPVYPFTLLAP